MSLLVVSREIVGVFRFVGTMSVNYFTPFCTSFKRTTKTGRTETRFTYVNEDTDIDT